MTPRQIAAIVLLPVTLALASCGGGGERQSSTPSASATAAGGSTVPQRRADARPPRSVDPYQGGEESIEHFGVEAAGAKRALVLRSFGGYLGAVAKGENAAACSRLSVSVRAALVKLAGEADGEEHCSSILARFLAPTAAAIAREQAEGHIAKVRLSGDRAFVVFHAPGARLYEMPMARERSDWRVAAVAASVLVPSAATLGRQGGEAG
jgi:hypothetical protein